MSENIVWQPIFNKEGKLTNPLYEKKKLYNVYSFLVGLLAQLFPSSNIPKIIIDDTMILYEQVRKNRSKKITKERQNKNGIGAPIMKEKDGMKGMNMKAMCVLLLHVVLKKRNNYIPLKLFIHILYQYNNTIKLKIIDKYRNNISIKETILNYEESYYNIDVSENISKSNILKILFRTNKEQLTKASLFLKQKIKTDYKKSNLHSDFILPILIFFSNVSKKNISIYGISYNKYKTVLKRLGLNSSIHH